MGMTAPLNLRG